MSQKLINYISDKFRIEKITPEQRGLIAEELEKIDRIKSESEIGIDYKQFHRLRNLLREVPAPSQQATLAGIYHFGDENKYITLEDLPCYIHDINLQFLEFMSVIEKQDRFSRRMPIRFKALKENMKMYWRDIEKWPMEYNKKTNEKAGRARHGQRIEEALEILEKKSIYQLTGSDISNLSRIDWMSRGWYIPRYTIHSLKKNLLSRINRKKAAGAV